MPGLVGGGDGQLPGSQEHGASSEAAAQREHLQQVHCAEMAGRSGAAGQPQECGHNSEAPSFPFLPPPSSFAVLTPLPPLAISKAVKSAGWRRCGGSSSSQTPAGELPAFPASLQILTEVIRTLPGKKPTRKPDIRGCARLGAVESADRRRRRERKEGSGTQRPLAAGALPRGPPGPAAARRGAERSAGGCAAPGAARRRARGPRMAKAPSACGSERREEPPFLLLLLLSPAAAACRRLFRARRRRSSGARLFHAQAKKWDRDLEGKNQRSQRAAVNQLGNRL